MAKKKLHWQGVAEMLEAVLPQFEEIIEQTPDTDAKSRRERKAAVAAAQGIVVAKHYAETLAAKE